MSEYAVEQPDPYANTEHPGDPEALTWSEKVAGVAEVMAEDSGCTVDEIHTMYSEDQLHELWGELA